MAYKIGSPQREARVSSDSSTGYTTLSEAFANGERNIVIMEGTYNEDIETAPIFSMSDGDVDFSIRGEGKVIINLNATTIGKQVFNDTGVTADTSSGEYNLTADGGVYIDVANNRFHVSIADSANFATDDIFYWGRSYESGAAIFGIFTVLSVDGGTGWVTVKEPLPFKKSSTSTSDGIGSHQVTRIANPNDGYNIHISGIDWVVNNPNGRMIFFANNGYNLVESFVLDNCTFDSVTPGYCYMSYDNFPYRGGLISNCKFFDIGANYLVVKHIGCDFVALDMYPYAREFSGCYFGPGSYISVVNDGTDFRREWIKDEYWTFKFTDCKFDNCFGYTTDVQDAMTGMFGCTGQYELQGTGNWMPVMNYDEDGYMKVYTAQQLKDALAAQIPKIQLTNTIYDMGDYQLVPYSNLDIKGEGLPRDLLHTGGVGTIVRLGYTTNDALIDTGTKTLTSVSGVTGYGWDRGDTVIPAPATIAAALVDGGMIDLDFAFIEPELEGGRGNQVFHYTDVAYSNGTDTLYLAAPMSASADPLDTQYWYAVAEANIDTNITFKDLCFTSTGSSTQGNFTTFDGVRGLYMENVGFGHDGTGNTGSHGRIIIGNAHTVNQKNIKYYDGLGATSRWIPSYAYVGDLTVDGAGHATTSTSPRGWLYDITGCKMKFKNINAYKKGGSSGMDIYNSVDIEVDNIELEEFTLTSSVCDTKIKNMKLWETGSYISDCVNVTFTDMKCHGPISTSYIFDFEDNCKNITINGASGFDTVVNVSGNTDFAIYKDEGKLMEGIRIFNAQLTPTTVTDSSPLDKQYFYKDVLVDSSNAPFTINLSEDWNVIENFQCHFLDVGNSLSVNNVTLESEYQTTGKVMKVENLVGGSGYSPDGQFVQTTVTGGSGTSLQLKIDIVGGVVTKVHHVHVEGTGYVNGETVTLNSFGGTGATVDVVIPQINGQNNFVMDTNGMGITVFHDGTNWYVK